MMTAVGLTVASFRLSQQEAAEEPEPEPEPVPQPGLGPNPVQEEQEKLDAALRDAAKADVEGV